MNIHTVMWDQTKSTIWYPPSFIYPTADFHVGSSQWHPCGPLSPAFPQDQKCMLQTNSILTYTSGGFLTSFLTVQALRSSQELPPNAGLSDFSAPSMLELLGSQGWQWKDGGSVFSIMVMVSQFRRRHVCPTVFFGDLRVTSRICHFCLSCGVFY